MNRWFKSEWFIGILLCLGSAIFAYAQPTLTTVRDTIYHADGSVAQGTILISWSTFHAPTGENIAQGNLSTTLGPNGSLAVSLTPNAGASPAGTYYTVVYHLDDGTVTREYWSVPASATPVTLQAVRTRVFPAAVATQTVTKQYVDQAITQAAMGNSNVDWNSIFITKTGDTMTGALTLPGDPTSGLQAATKNYVDTATTALQGGLAQKIATTSAITQTLTQPPGTQLRVNRLNGVLDVNSFQSGGVANDGIANLLGQTDCMNGCDAILERSYTGTDRVPSMAPNQTHVEDRRGGMQREYFINPHNVFEPGMDTGKELTVVQTQSASDVKAATTSETPSSFAMSIAHVGLAGGNNLFPENVTTSAIPYFKSNFSALQITGNYYTMGQHVLDSQLVNCYAVGDCLAGSRTVLSSGGFRDNADEGTHAYDFLISEDPRVFQGTCQAGCAHGATNLMIAPTKDNGTQGEGRFLLDLNPSKILSQGQLTGGNQSGSPLPTATFTGSSFPVSTFVMLENAILPQTTNMAPGTVTVALNTASAPNGYQINTTGISPSSGIACVVNFAPGGVGGGLNYEMAPYSVVDSSHLQLKLNKPHTANTTVAIGGLCGYGLEQTVDTNGGVRQVFPVIGSISSTALYYAGNLSSIVAAPFSTSSYLNSVLSIASISRQSGVVTVHTSNNMPADFNGLNLTIAGVTDSSYNGTFPITTLSTSAFTYNQTGTDDVSSGGTASIVTGDYRLYQMAEVLGVMNPTTRQIDGTMQLAPNTVAWAPGDAVEMPHYYLQKVGGEDIVHIVQQTPRPTTWSQRGVSYEGNVGPGIRGWYVANAADTKSYLGNGGFRSPPDFGMEVYGEWNTALHLEAGDRAAIAIDCNSRGCGRWNSTYNLIEMQNHANGIDALQYEPTTSTLNFHMLGTTYSMAPEAFTAAHLNTTFLNATAGNVIVGSGVDDGTHKMQVQGGLHSTYTSTSVASIPFSKTLALSVANGNARIVLSDDVLSSTISAGADGQRLCVNVVQDASGGHSFTWPNNMLGTMTVGSAAGKHNQQCFVYYVADGAWLAESPGVTNQ